MENDKVVSKPYMGNLTSAQIGNFARSGELGGEMVKRMVREQEIELMNNFEEEKK